MVSWKDAVDYAEWLSSQTGEAYRLPSEAEWEYAARAGTVTQYSWGDDIGTDRANCDDWIGFGGCGDRWEYTAPVGSFAANAWGLHDMHGNVKEWVQDQRFFDSDRNYESAPTDGSAWEPVVHPRFQSAMFHIVRGGSWWDYPLLLRTAYRDEYSSTSRHYHIGIRVARSLTPGAPAPLSRNQE